MRTLIALAALATSASLFAGSATEAFAGTAGYRLVPATAFSAANTVVARDVLWKCAGEACVATKATSRPEIVCSSAAVPVLHRPVRHEKCPPERAQWPLRL